MNVQILLYFNSWIPATDFGFYLQFPVHFKLDNNTLKYYIL